MKNIKYIIADNVRIYRKRKNLTQFELAERADLSLDSIKRVEGGKISISIEKFLKLSNALDVPVSCLINGEGEDISDIEQIYSILNGKTTKQKCYLLHMLQCMSEELDKL
ncbi:MAG: helix-turn-helix transcriptional regulator [Lachnospiraceae bacterium]|nr:helix-turn-helix transcriptional regulator [Lachnospiraceae bacterium]